MADRTYLVTGGCGFIGSCFIRMILDRDPQAQVINLDLLTYAGNPANVASIEESPRYRFARVDVRDLAGLESWVEQSDVIVHFAAESHVDRSTSEAAGAFIDTNVGGTFALLEAMRRYRPEARFLQIGTDEVYGDIEAPNEPDEDALLLPSSPYSASKAAADHVALSFERTHGLDVLVSRCTNNYGPYQYPEKMIPLFITNALENIPLPLYDGGTQIRDWLRVEDHCEAILLLLGSGESGEIYNIGANQRPERTNADITKMILECLGQSESGVEVREGLRPGHDQRYAVSTQKIRSLGWMPQRDITDGIEATVRWYADHRDWWTPLKSGAYRTFYEAHYGSGASDFKTS
ncbi:MAG: dTDP-glucose 4,6-dehydratase [bacterium TMED88]|nr:dTDP-glucose 4,6-dehydratase [Deltaproteobacteria bacterium]OUV36426.1 MAG: dTDP-glucose 4,6-dehydratase [bacterium TMED88]